MVPRTWIFVSLYLLSGVNCAPITDVECPVPDFPKPGQPHMTCVTVNCILTFNCPEGYRYTGTETRICQQDGQWSGSSGKCQAVRCPILRNPPNGRVEQNDRSFLDRATILCDEGFFFSRPGYNQRQCLGNQSWSKLQGTCEAITCPDIPHVEHSIHSSKRGRYMQEVHLECLQGYVPDGPKTSRCEANRKWSNGLGSCLQSSRTMSKNTTLVIVLATIFAVIILVVAAIACYLWHRKSDAEQAGEPHERLDLVKHAQPGSLNKLHCSFRMKGSSPLHDQTFIENQVQQAVGKYLEIDPEKDVKVNVISQEGQLVFIDIEYRGSEMKDLQITEAIKECAIAAGSVEMEKEGTSFYLKAHVLRKRHCTDNSKDNQIDLDTQYVRLKLLSYNKSNQLDDNEQNVHQDIEDEDLIKHHKYTLIRGGAGIGKSTLVQRLMWKWAKGEAATKFKAIFLLNARHLMTINGTMDLHYMLNYYSVYNTSEPSHKQHIITAEWLKKNEADIGFILDGIDEFRDFELLWKSSRTTNGAETKDWCFALMRREVMKKSMLLVSSRPFADLSLVCEKMKSVKQNHQYIEVMGLTRERIRTFVEKNVKKDRIEHVKAMLEKRPIILSVSSITFYCAAFCRLLEEQDEFPEDLTTYTQITAYIIEMFLQRSKRTADFTVIWKSDLIQLAKLAFNGIGDLETKDPPRLVFDKDDIQRATGGTDSTEDMDCSGLLVRTTLPGSNSQHQVFSQFLHLTIQEFLAMGKLLKCPLGQITKTVSQLATHGHFNMALLFIYGLAFSEKEDTVTKIRNAIAETIDDKAEILNALQSMALDVPDTLQTLKLAYESQSTEMAHKVGNSFPDRSVVFHGRKLTVIDILALIFLLDHHPDLDSLSLEHANLDFASIEELSHHLKTSSKLTAVKLIDNGIDDKCAEVLMAAIGTNRTLERLQIITDALRDDGMQHVSEGLKENDTIKSLILGCEKVTDAGAGRIAESLVENKHLESLKLYLPAISGKGVHYITDGLTSSVVRQFSLTWKGLTQDGGSYIANALKGNKTMKELSGFESNSDCDVTVFIFSPMTSLKNGGITDVGLKRIADELVDDSSLEELSLHCKGITDVGVMHIMGSLKVNKSLKKVSLLGFHVGESGVNSILKALNNDSNRTITIIIRRPHCSLELMETATKHPRIIFE